MVTVLDARSVAESQSKPTLYLAGDIEFIQQPFDVTLELFRAQW